MAHVVVLIIHCFQYATFAEVQTFLQRVRQIIALPKDALVRLVEKHVTLHADDYVDQRRVESSDAVRFVRIVERVDAAREPLFDDDPLGIGAHFDEIVDDHGPVVGGEGQDADEIGQCRGENRENLNGE